MWILYAAGSAFFAGITSILAKCGIKRTDSNLATAIRTIVVLVFSWIMVLITGQISKVSDIDGKTMLFLVLSGLATGASWLFYFKALQIGDVNKVVVIDKFSMVLTIILAIILLGEGISLKKSAVIFAIALGTLLMITPSKTENKGRQTKKISLLYAFLSAVFASLTAILSKIGMANIDSNLGTAIRTMVVLVMSWILVFVTTHYQKESVINKIKTIEKKELAFICLSGIATGASWLCYFRALKDGLASVVVPIDKLSILITVLFSWIVFREKLSKKAAAGLVLIVVGTVLLAVGV